MKMWTRVWCQTVSLLVIDSQFIVNLLCTEGTKVVITANTDRFKKIPLLALARETIVHQVDVCTTLKMTSN